MGSLMLIGSMTVRDLIPKLGEASTELSKSLGQLNSMINDKKGDLDKVTGQFDQLSKLLDEVHSVKSQADGLLNKATGVLGQAQSMVDDLEKNLSTAGIKLYRYEGEASDLGPSLADAETGSAHIVAMISLASDGGAVSALNSVFGG